MTRHLWMGLLVAGLMLNGSGVLTAQAPLDSPPPADAVVDPVDPADDPGIDPNDLPIEEQPVEPVDPAAPVDPVEPADAVPPVPGTIAPPPSPADPAYVRPVPPGADAAIPIQDVVRNPVRVYEARLLVLMGHAPAAAEAIGILGQRFPTDARVPYLRFFLQSRAGQPEAALESLRQAVALERLYPIGDYNRFMEPIQGPDRFYVERVRRAAAEIAALDRLAPPVEAELLPPSGPTTIEVPAGQATPPRPIPFGPRGVAPPRAVPPAAPVAPEATESEAAPAIDDAPAASDEIPEDAADSIDVEPEAGEP